MPECPVAKLNMIKSLMFAAYGLEREKSTCWKKCKISKSAILYFILLFSVCTPDNILSNKYISAIYFSMIQGLSINLGIK